MLRVKLLYDYTKYNEKLEKGIDGYAYNTPEETKNPLDKFVKVKFEGITEVDVPWKGLEILDVDYLKKVADREAKEKEEYFRNIENATNIVCTVGPKGGLRELKFEYKLNGAGVFAEITEKNSGEEHLEYFKKLGKDIKTIQLEKKVRGKRK